MQAKSMQSCGKIVSPPFSVIRKSRHDNFVLSTALLLLSLLCHLFLCCPLCGDCAIISKLGVYTHMCATQWKGGYSLDWQYKVCYFNHSLCHASELQATCTNMVSHGGTKVLPLVTGVLLQLGYCNNRRCYKDWEVYLGPRYFMSTTAHMTSCKYAMPFSGVHQLLGAV